MTLAAVSLLLAHPAQAAFPGQNGKIAFESPGNFGGRDIWVMDPDGSNQKDLTSDVSQFATNFQPTFSPDGKHIAFTKDTDPFGAGNDGIYVMNTDGTNQTELTSIIPNDQGYPSWSPDGKQIVFDNGIAIEAMSLTYDSNGNITSASNPTNLNLS